MDLFAEHEQQARRSVAPLAVRMRPRSLDEFVGQQHCLGPGGLLRRMIDADRLTSVILTGPPGTGKTTLAHLIAARTSAAFETLHAAESGVKDVRRVIDEAVARLSTNRQRTVLFLDEIHRFSKTQQDSLLSEVEAGLLTLVGATTENPFFSLTGALLSRSHVFHFHPLSPADLRRLLERALRDEASGLGGMHARVDADALNLLCEHADGDARRALAALEIAVLSQCHAAGRTDEPPRVDRAAAAASIQRALQTADAGDSHYDLASAFIKSLRGSDPDAALYWLARMLEGGEDPRFIARRIAICASEDVGNADPQALVVAASMLQVVELVGLPECEYALAQATTFVACAPKSNAVTRAIGAARQEVRDRLLLAVPAYLRDRQSTRSRVEGRETYVSPHDAPDGVGALAYLPEPRAYYNPLERGFEVELSRRLAALRAVRERSRRPAPPERS